MATTDKNQFQMHKWAGRTDMGHKRKVNEDCLVLIPEAGVLGVADGIGGGDSGDVASHQVAACLQEALSKAPEENESFDERVQRIQMALLRANKLVRDHGRRANLELCGSTVVLLVFDENDPAQARVIHAGDSRLYRMNSDGVALLTRDHNAANEFSAEILGRLKPNQHQHITRAIGIKDTLKTEVSDIRVAIGDRFLLCTDGLYGMVDPATPEGSAAWGEGVELEDASDHMIGEALRAGGRDNISMVLVVPRDVADASPGAIEEEAAERISLFTAKPPKLAKPPKARSSKVPKTPDQPKVSELLNPSVPPKTTAPVQPPPPGPPKGSEQAKSASVSVQPQAAEQSVPIIQEKSEASPSSNSQPNLSPVVQSASSAKPTRPAISRRLFMGVLGVVVAVVAIVSGVAWYDGALNRRAAQLENAVVEVEAQTPLKERVASFRSIAKAAELRMGEDYSESRWGGLVEKLSAALLDSQKDVEDRFGDALDGLSMEGPTSAFFQHVERLLETSTLMAAEDFAPFWGEELHGEILRRGANMQDVFKMVRYWDVLQRMSAMQSAEDLARGDDLLARIEMLDRDGNPFVRRVQEHPVMAGMRVKELASQHLDQLRTVFDQCMAEELVQFVELPGLDVEQLLLAVLGDEPEFKGSTRRDLIERNRAKLQANALEAQLAAYAPIMMDPADLQAELEYLEHTRALLSQWRRLAEGAERL